jgi:hypothetical protein
VIADSRHFILPLPFAPPLVKIMLEEKCRIKENADARSFKHLPSRTSVTAMKTTALLLTTARCIQSFCLDLQQTHAAPAQTAAARGVRCIVTRARDSYKEFDR